MLIERRDIRAAIPHALLCADLAGLGPRMEGKVRDIYVAGDRRVLVTTDRVSAFDRVLGAIPSRARCSTSSAPGGSSRPPDIVPNHVLAVPDPNVTIAREAEALPVEVIVRGYITGVTSTSLWTLYAGRAAALWAGPARRAAQERPAARAGHHADHQSRRRRARRAPDPAEVVERGLVAPALWAEVQAAALAVFSAARKWRAAAG